jgi:hypothetical protein
MLSSERLETRLPFPSLPEKDRAGFSLGNLALRPFGLDENDLSVDFDQPRPFLVTAILDRCTTSGERVGVDQAFLWSLTVGKRIECLLNLISPAGPSEMQLAFRCPHPGCGQDAEIELTIAEIAERQAEGYQAEEIAIEVDGQKLVLRRPTGNDQLSWLKKEFPSPASAASEMLATLCLETQIGDDGFTERMMSTVEQSMEEFDPLVNFSLSVKCPYCGEENPCEIDLEALALRRLQQAQLRLLASVHRLAAHYHWSEEQIFAVPHWRRAFYLELIEKEKDR